MVGGKMEDEVIILLLSAMPSDYNSVETSIDVLFQKIQKQLLLILSRGNCFPKKEEFPGKKPRTYWRAIYCNFWQKAV